MSSLWKGIFVRHTLESVSEQSIIPCFLTYDWIFFSKFIYLCSKAHLIKNDWQTNQKISRFTSIELLQLQTQKVVGERWKSSLWKIHRIVWFVGGMLMRVVKLTNMPRFWIVQRNFLQLFTVYFKMYCFFLRVFKLWIILSYIIYTNALSWVGFSI